MCKFHFVFNTVRSLSLDFESEVLPSGKDFQKNTSALRSGISLGALLWSYLDFLLRCLFVFMYMYMHGVSIPICIYGHTMGT